MLETVEPSSAVPCPSCGTELSPRLLACPTCHRLVHGARLKQLADSAEQAGRAGDLTAALTTWRAALELLPPRSRQHEIIAARVSDLGKRLDSTPGTATRASPDDARAGPRHGWAGAGGAAGAGGLALLVWKFKFVVVLLVSKAKFLLLGLTKASTFLSMFLSIGVYWAAFGWRLAVGLVVSIYVHEMGHVAALVRYGVRAGAPLFVPGLGAVIRLQQALDDPRQDARVGLAGPLWGLGAALVSAVVFLATAQPIWAAIAQLGAWINLFNLVPVWQLDGGRAFHALTRSQRWLAVMAIVLAWVVVSAIAPEGNAAGMLLIIAVVAAVRAGSGGPAQRPDRGTLYLYMLLIAALSAVTLVPVSLDP
jgi:Zn-dependent protease